MQDPSDRPGRLDPESPERRAFTVQSVLALLSGVTITVGGCGEDDSPTSPGPTPGGGVNGSVSANHGHSAAIESAQLAAANAVVLNIRGSATHPHTVELSSQEISQIAARQRVSKLSSTDDSPDAGRHSHNVTFN
jgi:hypothetical protein